MAFLAALTLGACNSKPVPAAMCHVTIEDIVTGDSLVVKRLIITAPGTRTVRLDGEGGGSQVFVEPDTKTGLMTAEVTLVANLIKCSDPSQNQLTWLAQVKCKRSSAGATIQYPAPSAKRLADVVTFSADYGDYPFGEKAVIGALQGREVALIVK